MHVIVWDEFPSNHKEHFQAAYKCLNGFENQVMICIGDFRQNAPVVQNGNIGYKLFRHLLYILCIGNILNPTI